MEKNISSSLSSSSSSDDETDADYYGSPRRFNKTRDRKSGEGGSSSTENSDSMRKRRKTRRLSRPPRRIKIEQVEVQNVQSRRRRRSKATNEGLTFRTLRRSTRRRGRNEENNDQTRTKKNVLSWLIDSGVLEEGQRVSYVNDSSEQALKEGVIKRDGILCDCCNEVFTVFDFEVHAGSDAKRPYENIVLVEEPRFPLLYYMIRAWYRQMDHHDKQHGGDDDEYALVEGDKHDDACLVCADGGNLLCCDVCPSTYHQACMDMDEVPQGVWLCSYCGCKVCGERSPENDNLVVTCFQCEKRYHWKCYQEKGKLEQIDLNVPGTPLCGQSCREVYEKLEKMVGVRKELDEGFSWTLLRRLDENFGINSNDLYEITECHAKLAVARSVMEECFEPIMDRHTRINIIGNVVYNLKSIYPRTNFRGFYTAILEKEDEIISVACLRIHGTKLAEMPFIATSESYRSQGMCRRLMVAIESALCYMKVENLVIPSVQERIGSWIERYGFRLIGPSIKTEIRLLNTLMFHDSFRLQKNLTASEATGSLRRPARG